MVAPEAVVLEDVEHARHLAEDEDARVLGLEARQQLVQDGHLAAVVHLFQEKKQSERIVEIE